MYYIYISFKSVYVNFKLYDIDRNTDINEK